MVLTDLESGNFIADFPSEGEAWDALCQATVEDGLASIANLSLLRMENGQPTLIAMDDDLGQRVVREMKRVPSGR